MSTMIGRERSLEKAIKLVAEDYDFHLHRHAAQPRAADDQRADGRRQGHRARPMQYLSMRGLIQLQNTLQMIRENLNPDVRSRASCPP